MPSIQRHEPSLPAVAGFDVAGDGAGRLYVLGDLGHHPLAVLRVEQVGDFECLHLLRRISQDLLVRRVGVDGPSLGIGDHDEVEGILDEEREELEFVLGLLALGDVASGVEHASHDGMVEQVVSDALDPTPRTVLVRIPREDAAGSAGL